MTTSIKNSFFFLSIFVLFITFSYLNEILIYNNNYNATRKIFIGSGILFTLITFLIFFFGSIGNCPDNFTFEVTPAKLCSGGPYMYSSNPEKQQLCNSITPEEMSRYTCPNGFHGAPVHFEYDPLSDDNWENNMCKNFNESSTQPL